MSYTERIVDAIRLAHELHADQRRKGSGTPYLNHLLAVAALVGEYGGDEDQFIAAILHDAVEDQGGKPTLKRIRTQFGPAVADLVWECSDSHTEPRPPWQMRKDQHIAHVKTSSPELRLIIAADKLHNAQSILRDLRQHGPDVWKRFQGGRKGMLWYLESMMAALQQGWTHPILDELAMILHELKVQDPAPKEKPSEALTP